MRKTVKELIRDELRTLGVSASRLIIGLSDRQIIYSGELDSFYQIQLAQLAARRVAPEFEVVLNLSVFNPQRALPNKLSEESELHQLRNQLNEYAIGLQLVATALHGGDVSQANRTVARLLGRIPISDMEPMPESFFRES